jgi:hypothetical protein
MKFTGRLYKPDRRDKKFKIPKVKTDMKSRLWKSNWWTGDQGNTPSCAGFAAAHWLAAKPINQWLNPYGLYFYANATDEWAPRKHKGTSVRAVMKVLNKMGFVKEYLWTSDLQVLINAVLEVSPVVVGTSWGDGMMRPDKNGFLDCSRLGSMGHAYLIVGVDTRPKQQFFTIRNSWGTNWGVNGKAKIRFDDMQKLIRPRNHGEVCLAIERKIIPNI